MTLHDAQIKARGWCKSQQRKSAAEARRLAFDKEAAARFAAWNRETKPSPRSADD